MLIHGRTEEAIGLPEFSADRIAWVAKHLLPAEPNVRASLRASGMLPEDIDDLIQDAYCRFGAMPSVGQIECPASYFMQIAKNLRIDRLRREKVIRFKQITDLAEPSVNDGQTGLEEEVGARRELQMVIAVLEALPERCRNIFTLKRLEGLSQKEIAHRLQITENIVENDVRKAVRALQAALRESHDEDENSFAVDRHRARS